MAVERLSLTAQGHIRYALKTPYRDGTTHVVFEPEDFLSRVAALVPSPRVNLTRFHGVFAPHHELRSRIVLGSADSAEAQAEQGKRGARATSMGWAQRLRRVFAIEIERCERWIFKRRRALRSRKSRATPHCSRPQVRILSLPPSSQRSHPRQYFASIQ